MPRSPPIATAVVGSIIALVGATMVAGYPGRPVLAIVDYLQIIGDSEDQRLRVSKAMEGLAVRA